MRWRIRKPEDFPPGSQKLLSEERLIIVSTVRCYGGCVVWCRLRNLPRGERAEVGTTMQF